MNAQEQTAKLTEFWKQLDAIQIAMRSSGVDEKLISDAVNSIEEAKLDIGASRIVLRREMHYAGKTA